MPHQHHVVLVVHRVILGERPTRAEAVEDLHRLDVLDFHFAGYRHAPRGEQAVAEDDGAYGVLVGRVSAAHVVVGQRTEAVASTSRSMATEVRAARSSSSAEQSGCTSKASWKWAARSRIYAAVTSPRSSASSSTSTISMCPPKVAHCRVRSV